MRVRALLPVLVLPFFGCGRPEGNPPPEARHDGGGSVSVTLGFNLCPEFEFTMMHPRDIESGETSALVVSAKDPEGGEVTYRWRATTGSFSERDLPVTVYSCEEPGRVTLTVTADDEGGCSVPRSFEARCLE